MTHAILDGFDLAMRDGITDRNGKWSQVEWIKRVCRKQNMDTPFTGKIDNTAREVEAFIGSGKWSAQCPVCGVNATEYVNPVEAVFYCFNCGNREIGGAGRHVVFPSVEERIIIEKLLLERPVDDRRGSNKLHQATQAQPIAPGYFREWGPAVSIKELQEHNDHLDKKLKNKVAVPRSNKRRPIVDGVSKSFLKRTAPVGEHLLNYEDRRIKGKR